MDNEKTYSISEVSKLTGIPISTLRYYDNQHLLPNLQRLNSGYRVFTDADIENLKIITCFKNTGMSLSDIKQYFQLVALGDSTLTKRYQMMLNRRKTVEDQIKFLENQLTLVDKKIHYYENQLNKK